jgi:hypothetical protein
MNAILRRAGRLLLRAFSPRSIRDEINAAAERNAVEAADLILSLMPNKVTAAKIAYDLVYGATKIGLTLFLAAPLLLALLPLLCLLFFLHVLTTLTASASSEIRWVGGLGIPSPPIASAIIVTASAGLSTASGL